MFYVIYNNIGQGKCIWYHKNMGRKGFTLVELLITIAIIGILAGIAITSYVGSTTKAARSEAYSNLESLRLLEESFFADNGDYTGALGSSNCTTFAQRDTNVGLIQADLPLFRPGNAAQFCYFILANEDIVGGAQTPCFHAVAVGLPNTRVDGDTFDIDCNNDTTY
jgi:prepilin-type N-terminal cleavage/methylation domain-containing protein